MFGDILVGMGLNHIAKHVDTRDALLCHVYTVSLITGETIPDETENRTVP